MRYLFRLATAVLLLILVTACAANDTDNTAPAIDELQGPALIVFYTDN